MKKIITFLRNIGRVFGSLALLAFAAVGTAFADNISKTFEFGPGTQYPRSNVRTFNIPCGTPGGVAAVVKFQRLGPDGAGIDIPIVIEFREPDTAANQEGPIVETKTATARKTEQTVILRSQSSNRGCSLPWRVRVRYANEGTAPVQTFGSIRLDFDGRERWIDGDNLFPNISKGSSVTINLGGSDGFEQGIIDVRASWIHDILGLRGPNDFIKLKWELIDPNGTIVRTVEAYSYSNENGSPRLVLIYQVTKHTPGRWKMKITNTNANDDAKIKRYDALKFTPGCP